MDQRRVRCTTNKFDRLIAQKISLNDLSRPILNSDGTFGNPFPTWNQRSFFEVMQFVLLDSDQSGLPSDPAELEKALPILKPDFGVDPPAGGDFRLTWIGHSTLLIQVDGLNILTDPIFSDRASPVQFMGPKRFRAPACNISSLPRIDIVLISHNHYDHLDSGSVRQLNDRFGSDCRWIVPLGLGEFLSSMKVSNYVELDWWQKDCHYIGGNSSSATGARSSRLRTNLSRSLTLNQTDTQVRRRSKETELDIYLTPSQHWSRRGLSDIMKTLWGSFTIVSSGGSSFFFAGDTGYCPVFKEIGKIFGPFAGAAIPIGAYKPQWFLKPQHVDPIDAIKIHRDLKSAKSIAIHHATFNLGHEFYLEPQSQLRSEMEKLVKTGLCNEPFVSLKHGESTTFVRALPAQQNQTAASVGQ